MKPIPGRSPLSWLVVNTDGKLLAVLDSSSEAFWFTRNRGHAVGATIVQADFDYAQAPELRSALSDCAESLSRLPDADRAYRATCLQQARTAIANATA